MTQYNSPMYVQPQQPMQQSMQPQELFIAKYSSGTVSVTPYELVITHGRSQTVIPMGSVSAIRYTKNLGT